MWSMPTILYYLGWVSQLVVPVFAIALAIIIMTCVEGSHSVYPYLVWVCLMEFGAFINYLWWYRKPLCDDYDDWVKLSKAMIQVNKRKRHLES